MIPLSSDILAATLTLIIILYGIHKLNKSYVPHYTEIKNNNKKPKERRISQIWHMLTMGSYPLEKIHVKLLIDDNVRGNKFAYRGYYVHPDQWFTYFDRPIKSPEKVLGWRHLTSSDSVRDYEWR